MLQNGDEFDGGNKKAKLHESNHDATKQQQQQAEYRPLLMASAV
jgi:hypothetical protein